MLEQELVLFEGAGGESDDAVIADLKALYKEADFVVWSDASAVYTDGVGTWATLIFSRVLRKSYADWGLSTASNTNRAEFSGLLTGLARVSAVAKELGMVYPGWSPTILVIGDRENIIEAIENKDSRKSDVDLWAAYRSYEERGWRIRARHVPRDCKLVNHELLDKVASELRVCALSYLENSSPSFPWSVTAIQTDKH